MLLSLVPNFFLSLSFVILSSLFLSLAFAVLVSQFGSRIALLDKPNERSSHFVPTPRSGGIGIWLALILSGVFIAQNVWFTLIVTSAGLLGLFEDRYNLSSILRLVIQIVLSLLAVFLFSGLPATDISIAIFLFWVLFIAGTANFYNFMDGINGIAGLTGVAGFGLMGFFSFYIANEPDITLMSIALVAACLGFLPFNFPRARVFMGDVGSTLLGFVFAAFVVKMSVNINIFLCLIMFLCTFYSDALLTIYYRWKRGENLLEAHRCHLYQYLSNELDFPHWMVSLFYFSLQLSIGILALWAYQYDIVAQVVLIAVYALLFITIYKFIKKIRPKQTLATYE